MVQYTLERMEQIRGKQVFDKLVVDGVAPFDTFISLLEETYRSEVRTLYSLMDAVANLMSLPETKFHPYSDGKDGVREYEFKTKHLRVYAIEQTGGKIIIIGGTKANQRKDQAEFRRLKNAYIASK
jgi:hypothetical protein